MEFFQAPIWGFAGAVVGLLGIIAAVVLGIILYRKQRTVKGLSYTVLAEAPVVSIHQEAKGDEIKILFRGHPVTDVTLLVVKVWNSGNVEIRPTDFFSPLYLKLSGQLLSTDVLEKVPPELPMEGGGGSDGQHTTLQWKPMLLNQGDGFTEKVLLTDFNGDISVEARIAGLKSINRVQVNELHVRELLDIFLREVLVAVSETIRR